LCHGRSSLNCNRSTLLYALPQKKSHVQVVDSTYYFVGQLVTTIFETTYERQLAPKASIELALQLA